MNKAARAAPYAAAAVYILFLGFYFPLGSAIEYGADEGFELIKALMVSKGFSLYGEIWNDQPPLHTLMVALLFKSLGPEVGAARSLTLVFSGVLLFSLVFCLQLSAGRFSALFGLLLLAASPYFSELSLSAMLEIPAVATGCLSTALLLAYRRWRKDPLLWCSALAFGLGLQVKLTVAIFAPALVYALFSRVEPVPAVKKTAWFSLAALTVLAIGVLTGEDIAVFIDSHFGGLKEPSFQFSLLYARNREILIPLVLLAPVLFFAGDFHLRFYAVFMASVFTFFLAHRPFWYYYELHFAVAASLLLPQLAARLPKRPRYRKSLAVVLGALCALILLLRGDRAVGEIHRLKKKREVAADTRIERMVRYRDSTRWIYTDRPIFAFHAGLAMPPFLAVMPYKRVKNGLLPAERILAVLKDYRPEQILLFRPKGPTSPPRSFLDENYRPISTEGAALFVRKDLPER